MRIETTGREEILIRLSLEEAEHVARFGFDSLNKFGDTSTLPAALRREREMSVEWAGIVAEDPSRAI